MGKGNDRGIEGCKTVVATTIVCEIPHDGESVAPLFRHHLYFMLVTGINFGLLRLLLHCWPDDVVGCAADVDRVLGSIPISKIGVPKIGSQDQKK